MNVRTLVHALVFGLGSVGCDEPGGRQTGDGGFDSTSPTVEDTAPDVLDDAEPDGTIGGPNAPIPTETATCGIGPIVRTLEVEGTPCAAEPAAQCPTAASPDSQPVLLFASCPIAADGTDCTPVFEPSCPQVGDGTSTFFDANLVNPNPGAPFTCWGRVHVLSERSGAGVDVHVQGFGGHPDDCEMQASEELQLHLEPCCQSQIDFYYPAGDFTFRLRLQLDWTP